MRRTHFLERADGFVAQYPGGRCARVPVEEGARIGAADPARLDSKKRAVIVGLGLGRVLDFDCPLVELTGGGQKARFFSNVATIGSALIWVAK